MISGSLEELNDITSINSNNPDDAFILAASWEQRCLGVAKKLRNYRARQVILTIYDGESASREKHIAQLGKLLEPIGPLHKVPAKHAYPITNVRETISLMRKTVGSRPPRITLDISTFTTKHFLQLLQGLDLAGMLGCCRFLYTEALDYHTADDEPISQGISSVKAVETFSGYNSPSRDTLLILFLGYEGRRALALWEHLEPNITLAVIPDPPYRPAWVDRTETQNHYLLSCLRKEQVHRTNSLIPVESEHLLNEISQSTNLGTDKYNYCVAPLGTKAQTLGIYRFWRQHRGLFTLMYARPVRYREEKATFGFGRTWMLDDTASWH